MINIKIDNELKEKSPNIKLGVIKYKAVVKKSSKELYNVYMCLNKKILKINFNLGNRCYFFFFSAHFDTVLSLTVNR